MQYGWCSLEIRSDALIFIKIAHRALHEEFKKVRSGAARPSERSEDGQ